MGDEESRKGLRAWKWTLLLVLLLTVACLFVGYRMSQTGNLEQRLQALREQGQPLTLEELDRFYAAVPDGENAARVYAKAEKAFQPDAAAEAVLPFMGKTRTPEGAWPEDLLNRAERYLTANAETLALLHEAGRMPRCRHDVDMRKAASDPFGHTKALRNLGRLLELQTAVEARRGRCGEALESVHAMLGLARSCKKEPLFLVQLVRILFQDRAMASLFAILNAGGADEPALAAAQRRISEEIAEDDFPLMGLVGERCAVVDAFQSKGGRFRQVGGLYRVLGLQEGDLCAFLDISGRLCELAAAPYPDRLQTARFCDGEAMKLSRMRVLTRLMLPSLSTVVRKGAPSHARLQLGLAAVAVERYRLKHGGLPESLDALVPEFLDAAPLDPFDGQPIRFKRLEKGYRLYSIGDNLKDDGGQGLNARRLPLDIVFEIHR